MEACRQRDGPRAVIDKRGLLVMIAPVSEAGTRIHQMTLQSQVQS
jgi:hypothetical protein